jgi:membrane-associated protease RseP (regulator of RpoE activity)
MSGLLLILSAILITYVVFLIFQFVGGKLVGAEIEEVGLFLGPALLSFKLGGIKFRSNAPPFGSFVKFSDNFDSVSA